MLLPATLHGTTADTALGAIADAADGGRADGTVMLRPEQISIAAGGDATVTAVHYFGADTRYEVSVPGVDLADRRARRRVAAAPTRATRSP